MDTENRLKREKEFHNETFSSNSRKAAKKYYQSANSSKKFYRDSITRNVKGKKVLEYGCGPGSAAFDLARLGAEVYAIDISDVAIAQTKEHASKEGLSIDCRVMDAENLDFENQSFDIICGSGILHHLDLERAYAELNRTLKPDGKAVFFEPLGHNPIINLYRKLTPSMRTEDEHPLLMKDIKLCDEYFGEVRVTYFNLVSILSSFVKPLQSIFNRIDEQLFKSIPPLRKHAWIIVLEFYKPI